MSYPTFLPPPSPTLPSPEPQPAPRRPWPWLLGLLVVVLVAAGVTAVVARSSDGDGSADLGQPASEVPPTTAAEGTAPAPSSTPTTAPPDVPRAQKRVFDELMAQVAQIRGLQWRGPLNLKVVPSSELARLLKEANDRDIKPEQLAAEGEALKLLQLIPPDADLREILDDVLAGVVLGFYDPNTKELFVGGDEIDFSTKYTIVHEMVHALTDQVFNYGPATQALDDAGKSDQSAAYSGLLEGDAVLTSNLWAEKYLTEEEALLAILGGGSSDGVDALTRTPAYVIQALFFPYDEGASFVEALYESGGYAAVDAAYRKPPTSTEQIIHPETYLGGEGSPAPGIPDVAAAAGCARIKTGTMGLFDMRAVLGKHVARTEAANAVEGWNGDTYGLVRCGGSLGMADRWQTDPGTDPSVLASALAKWAAVWSGSGRQPGADGRFSGSKGAGRIVRSGNGVDIVLAQDQDTAERLIRAFG